MKTSSPQRTSLLPLWIKILAWIFSIQLLLVLVFFSASFFREGINQWSFFGNHVEGKSTGLYPLLVQGGYLLAGAAAFGLLRGKKWGLNLSLVLGVVWLIFSVNGLISRLGASDLNAINLASQILILFIAGGFLYSLWKIRPEWNTVKNSSS